ncbi:MAG: hypothetical protein R3C28_25425 [Pirellulaceae bacterium]
MGLELLIPIAAFVGVAALIGGVAIMLRGTTDSAVEDRLGMLTGTGAKAKKAAEKESSVISKPLDDMPGILEEFASRFLNLSLLLEQAAIQLSPGKFVLITIVLGVVGTLAMFLAPVSFWFAPLGGAFLGSFPLMFAIFKRKRRKKQFGAQLPEAAELIARLCELDIVWAPGSIWLRPK